MVQTTSTMIYIGNLPIIDTDESNPATENAGAIAGTYIDAQMQMVDVTNFDEDNDGVIWSDESGGPDYVTYTLRDGGLVTTEQDAIIIYSARITEVDGTIHDVEVSVVQMPNGDTFVNDFGAAGNTDNLFIDSIELITPTTTGSAGRNTFATSSNTTVCFTAGTLICTPEGPRLIETLLPGELVETLDHGPQPILWRRQHVGILPPDQQPIRIARGALGCDKPDRPLLLSPQHRVMINGPVVVRMFDTDAVLVAAKRLLPLVGVTQATMANTVRYWHILTAHHAIVFAEGTPVETLWPGPEARRSIPDHVPLPRLSEMRSARPIPDGSRQKRLVSRLVKNNKPCLSQDQANSALHARIGALARQNAAEAARFVQ